MGQHQQNAQSIQLFGKDGKQNNKNISFRDAWRKAIEKYSPKKPTRLNEVSFRFQNMLEEARKANLSKSEAINEAAKKDSLKLKNVSMMRDDEDMIKFVSMIDQRPIRPAYLELSNLKDYYKKAQEA